MIFPSFRRNLLHMCRPVSSGRDAGFPFEHRGEIVFVRETELFGDLLDRHGGTAQQHARGFEFALDQVLRGRFSVFVFEDADRLAA